VNTAGKKNFFCLLANIIHNIGKLEKAYKTRRPKKYDVSNETGCDTDGDEDEEDPDDISWGGLRDGETLDRNGNLGGLCKDPAEKDSKSNMDSDNDCNEDEEDDTYGSGSDIMMK
jgi:hypothetical protein